jgi:hypothetical protein
MENSEISTILIHLFSEIQTCTPLSVLPEAAATCSGSYVRKQRRNPWQSISSESDIIASRLNQETGELKQLPDTAIELVVVKIRQERTAAVTKELAATRRGRLPGSRILQPRVFHPSMPSASPQARQVSDFRLSSNVGLGE